MDETHDCEDGVIEQGISIEQLKERYSDAELYRTSEYHYNAGTTFSGSMIAGICYAYSGHVTYIFGANAYTLSTGQCAKLPGGEYECKVSSDSNAIIVVVWKIKNR